MKNIVNFNNALLERDSETYLSLIYSIFCKSNFKAKQEHERANLAWGMTFSLEILKNIILYKREHKTFDFFFECRVFNLAMSIFNVTEIENHLKNLIDNDVSFDFSILQESDGSMSNQKFSNIRDLGFMVIKGLTSSVDLSSETTILSLLLFKLFEVLELSSQRFYCENFTLNKKNKTSIQKFRMRLLKWTYISSNDRGDQQDNSNQKKDNKIRDLMSEEHTPH